MQANDVDTFSELSDIPNHSDEDILAKSDKATVSIPAQRTSDRLRTQPKLDYQKINQGRAANVKSHPSVTHNSLHSKPSQALLEYPLSHVLSQAPQGFVRIARKSKRSTPDLPSLKESDAE